MSARLYAMDKQLPMPIVTDPQGHILDPGCPILEALSNVETALWRDKYVIHLLR